MKFTTTIFFLLLTAAVYSQSIITHSAQVDSNGFYLVTDTQTKTPKGVTVSKDITNPMTRAELETEVRALDTDLRLQLKQVNNALLATEVGANPKAEIEQRAKDADLRRRLDGVNNILISLLSMPAAPATAAATKNK